MQKGQQTRNSKTHKLSLGQEEPTNWRPKYEEEPKHLTMSDMSHVLPHNLVASAQRSIIVFKGHIYWKSKDYAINLWKRVRPSVLTERRIYTLIDQFIYTILCVLFLLLGFGFSRKWWEVRLRRTNANFFFNDVLFSWVIHFGQSYTFQINNKIWKNMK